ncbi:flavin containing amine oxidoreductase [Colletotrichum orchidophilum]|uniref:Flavin containing amine oxidoreductase n=1 Tax=Colletotrichum orchidophilum TaxID=1209926 RepID=A0A1G4B0E2_9PEZI|nr:flavin containing amine oxidoreductase [Colletotrichum orchidophilum]OHE94888.1 flavin containing amine oxidoreductase [Colletotrichum orchidophilum]
MAPPEPLPVDSKVSYKYIWAQFVAQRKLENDLKVSKLSFQNLGDGSNLTPVAGTVSSLSEILKKATGGGVIPPKPGHFNVGIIGSGVAGLFTALALDWINDTIEEQKGAGHLKITYEILEASDEKRFGGRLYTHRFSDDGVHDYYDVGAMRFPKNAVMDRTFRLFNMLGIEQGQLGDRTHVDDPPRLIKYYLRDDNNVCPTYFNNVRKVGNPFFPDDETKTDPFGLNKGIAEDKQIPDRLTRTDPGVLFETAIGDFIAYVKKSLDDYIDDGTPMNPEDEKKLWDLLMRCDQMSVRQFLRSVEVPGFPEDAPKGPGFSYNTIQWLETATYGTGWYDQSLTEAVLESIDFYITDDPKKGKEINNHWFCIDGGAQKIAEEMRKNLKNQSAIQFNTQVVGMDANVQLNKRVTKDMTLKLRDSATGKALPSKDYFTVFNATTLGSVNRMDLSKAGLLWDTKQAIRCLGYGASCKVGIKFKTPWWQKAPYNIDHGGIARTDLPAQVCVYPSYNINKDVDPRDKPAVLLVSYTWGQTAQRLASLIASKPRGKPNAEILREEAELRDVMLRDLAYLHTEDPNDSAQLQRTLQHITEQYVEHHAYDWYHDPNMAGAFAYFGPSQFSELYPAITKPNAGGQLYFVGEAASAHHAWVVGALESVVRALWLLFDTLHQGSRNDPNTQGAYEAYKWAMDLLECGHIEQQPTGGKKPAVRKAKSPLPFYPLPAEMPRERRQHSHNDSDESDDTDTQGGPGPAVTVVESAGLPEVFQAVEVAEDARAVAFSQPPVPPETISPQSTQDLSDHPEMDGTTEVPLKYGAALVALSMVESVLSTLAELSKEELDDQISKL